MNERSTTIVVVSAVLGLLATLTVGLRFWARHLKRMKFGIDDILSVLALILTLSVVAIDIVAATWSRVGEHEILIPSGPKAGQPYAWEIRRQSITLWSVEILHTCAMPAIKAYTLSFYLRIFVSETFRRVAFAVGGFVFCWWVGVLFAAIFQCNPVGPVVVVHAKCFDVLKFLQITAILNVITDAVVIFMPIPVLVKLHMPFWQKLAVIGIFLTSSLVIVAGIGRTVTYYDVSNDYDYSWHDYHFIIWTSIEPCMGMIGACLPSCRPVFEELSPESLLGSIRSTSLLRSMGSSNNMPRERRKYPQPFQDSSVDWTSTSNSVNKNKSGGIPSDQSFDFERRGTTMDV